MKYRKAVFVVTYAKVKDKINYLILKRKLHWKGWEFPKGGLETLGEKLFVGNAVKREVKEETGLTPIKIKKMNISGKYKYKRVLKDRPGVIGQEYKLYSAEVEKKKINIKKNKDAEHSTYKWVDFKTANKLLSWPNQRQCLKIVNNSLENEI
jgi:8-oxo-dGTP pyrophosphatase MutT (NUDIX family)